jgi:cellulose synthase/poly-beta-1,6-N-acetylglucosamine synthase-like glycosyltransferase
LLRALCLTLFALLAIVPALYGLHMYVLMVLAARKARAMRRRQAEVIDEFARETRDEDWPAVTTQIPLYNERAVARRIIEAVAAIDYPRDRHQIQVLDDSSDETREIVDRTCERLRMLGHDVVVVRREKREHYKAGALAHGLTSARGEYVAIFDADFVPEPGFLRQLIPLIATDARIGCAQARWGHLNQHETWITRALSLGVDGHFGVEQPARAWNGFLLNFNGTAGVWRRATLEDPRVGGWSGDTITEDFDLSYRAQLAGWKVAYCMDVVAPAEIPADADSLKAQQRRWATGSTQCARKLLPLVWRSPLTLLQKLEATAHLTQYSVNIFMVLMALAGRWLLWTIPPAWVDSFAAATALVIALAALAPALSYVYARHAVFGRIPGPAAVVRLIVLGLGLSLNNAAAVLAGLTTRGGEFVRTPKSGSTRGRRRQSAYAAGLSRLWPAEILLGVGCLAQWMVFLETDRYIGGTFLLFYAIGLIGLGWGSAPWSRLAPGRMAERAGRPLGERGGPGADAAKGPGAAAEVPVPTHRG